MSVITGIYNRDGRPGSSAEIGPMLASLAYRAPTRAPSTSGPLALAPAHASADLLVAADARLDNRAELAAALQLNPAGADDAALILAGYREWGQAVAERLLGDFAFAIWDARQGRLLCARDPFGVKQLYYYRSARLFAFASEVAALLAHPAIPRRANEGRIGDLLLQLYDDQHETLYQEIYRLPPATVLLVDAANAAMRHYWQPNPRREIRFRSDADYAAAFRDLLTEAVRCRLPDGDPVGAALSGGIDSSAVTCIARDLLVAAGRAPLHTFSAVYPASPPADERRYAEAIVRQGGVVPHFVNPAATSPFALWETRRPGPDEPILSPTEALTTAVYTAARDAGASVYLEGLGGDSVIGHGREYLNELARHWRFGKLLREARQLERRGGGSARRMVRDRLWMALPAPLARWRRGAPPPPPWQVRLNDDFVARVGPGRDWEGRIEQQRTPWRSHRLAQCAEFAGGAYSSLSLVFTDRLAARLGLEVRYPFFDKRLVEYCLALPPNQKLRDGWTRWIARQALSDMLPAEVRNRSGKANFTPAANAALIGPGRALLEDVLREPGPIAGIVALADIRARYRSLLDNPASVEGRPLWLVAVLGLWLREQAL